MNGSQVATRTEEATPTAQGTKLDYVAVKSAAMTLRAINHKLRQQIIRLLDEHQRMNVTDIYVKLRLEQSVASQHLAILRRANIVATQRDGKFIHYSLNHARIQAISGFVSDLVNSEESTSRNSRNDDSMNN